MLSCINIHKIKHWVIDDYLSDIRYLGKPTLYVCYPVSEDINQALSDR